MSAVKPAYDSVRAWPYRRAVYTTTYVSAVASVVTVVLFLASLQHSTSPNSVAIGLLPRWWLAGAALASLALTAVSYYYAAENDLLLYREESLALNLLGLLAAPLAAWVAGSLAARGLYLNSRPTHVLALLVGSIPTTLFLAQLTKLPGLPRRLQPGETDDHLDPLHLLILIFCTVVAGLGGGLAAEYYGLAQYTLVYLSLGQFANLVDFLPAILAALVVGFALHRYFRFCARCRSADTRAAQAVRPAPAPAENSAPAKKSIPAPPLAASVGPVLPAS